MLNRTEAEGKGAGCRGEEKGKLPHGVTVPSLDLSLHSVVSPELNVEAKRCIIAVDASGNEMENAADPDKLTFGCCRS